MPRPPDLYDRALEWDDLERFVTSPRRGLRVGLLYGRRRVGKSFLLRRLAREHGGIYHMALEEEPAPALRSFADTVGARLGLAAGQLRLRDWAEGLRAALAPGNGLLIIDELPYLLAHAPGRQLPSALQALVDESRDDVDTAGPRQRVILCGSALAVMSELLSGGKPLRGRAELDLLLRPFDYRTTAGLYEIADPLVAFRMYAIFGGVPGYRDLLGDPSPRTGAELDELLLATALSPSHALFSETAYLLREDPRITERALYHSVLAAVAGGASTPSKIGAAIGRDQRSLAHALDVLETAGVVHRDEDVLLQRRPTLTIADPIVRFHELVVVPRLAAFEDRRAAPAWQAAQETLRSRIYGPAFEALAREWAGRYASERTLGGPAGIVGATVVNDRAGRSMHEVDVVVLPAGQPRLAPEPSVLAIGEAKDSDRARTVGDVARLEKIRALLVGRGVAAASCRLLVFGRSGFDEELTRAAAGRHDVELVDLDRIRYGD